MYVELSPSHLLDPYVETYWIIDDMKETKSLQNVLPDGCIDIIVSLGDSSLDNGFKQNIPYVFGTHTALSGVPVIGNIQMFGIRFKPAVFKLFTKIPVNEFTNQKADIFSFQSLFDLSFYHEIERALEANLSMTDIIGKVELFLISKLPVLPSVNKRIQHAISLIQFHAGNMAIDKLAVESCMSERQLERRFKAEVGISPKLFSRIMKFREVHKRLYTNTWENLQQLAWECGYFDNAHLTKEYLKFTGTLPSDLSL